MKPPIGWAIRFVKAERAIDSIQLVAGELPKLMQLPEAVIINCGGGHWVRSHPKGEWVTSTEEEVKKTLFYMVEIQEALLKEELLNK